MFSLARGLLTFLFLMWSLLLLGGGSLIGLVGDGLASLLSGAGLAWLASGAEGLGKALVFIVWITSACVYGVFFALLGKLRLPVPVMRPEAQAPVGDAVTLNRDKDGVYR